MTKAQVKIKSRKRWSVIHELRRHQNLTFREIGERFGVTRDRARQLYLRACREIRKEQAKRDQEVIEEEHKGAQMIIDLQAIAGITEPFPMALQAWRAMSVHDRENTKAAHQVFCAPKEEPAGPAPAKRINRRVRQRNRDRLHL